MIKRPKKILHLADTHCFQKKRHQEYKEVTDRLCELIIKEKVDLVYIGGDVIDSKARLTPEQIETVAYFFYKISDLTPIILIPGNHDVDLKQRGSLDSLTPIIDNITPIHPIYYLKDSGVYKLYDIDWIVWSCLDGENPLEGFKADKEAYTIGCYHGAVVGSKTDSNWAMSGEIDIKAFKDCKNVFLGDIHLQQDFRNKEIAYSGSWYQVKIDELEDKGCLIWSWNEKKKKYIYNFRKLNNRFGFKTFEIKDIDSINEADLIAPSEDFLIRLLYTGPESSFSTAKFNELKKRLAHNLPNEVVLQKRFQKVTSIKKIKTTVTDKTDFFEMFYEKKGLKKPEIAQLRLIDAEFTKRIDDADYQTGEYFIEEVEINNFLCFGPNNIINFNKLPGLVGLFAENRTGKSSVLESIVFALFNKSVKSAVSIAKLINDQTPKETKAHVQIKLTINGVKWRIKRTIIPKTTGAKINLEVYETVAGVEVPRHEESRTKTDAGVLRKLLGDEKIFLTTVLSDLANSTEFVDSKNAERLDLIIKFLGITIYDLKLKLCEEEIKSYGYEHEVYKRELVKLIPPHELEVRKTELLNEIKNSEALFKNSEVLLKDYAVKLEKYRGKIKKLNIIGVSKTEAELKKELPGIELEIKTKETQLKTNISAQDGFIDSWVKNKNTGGVAPADWKADYTKHDENKLTIYGLENDIKLLNGQLTSENCPTCKQVWHKINRDKIEKEISRKKVLIESLENKSESWALIQQTLSEIKLKISQLDNLIELGESKIEMLKSKKETAEQQLKIIEDSKLKIAEKDKYEEAVEEIVVKMEGEASVKQTHESTIKYANKELVVIGNNIKLYNEKLAEIEKQEVLTKSLVLYKSGVHRTGIPSLILETYIPAINEEINSQINDLFDLNVRFDLVEDKLEVSFHYDAFENDGRGKRDIVQASGMEGTIINLAIRAALSKISLLPKPSFLMLDEIFNTLDKDNVEQVKAYLLRLKEQYHNIIIISHRDEVKDLPSYIIHLEKVAGITSII